MSRKHPTKKEYGTYEGVQASLLASLNLNKGLWLLPPSTIFKWYLGHLAVDTRLLTLETALQYKQELEKEIAVWLRKNRGRMRAEP